MIMSMSFNELNHENIFVWLFSDIILVIKEMPGVLNTSYAILIICLVGKYK